MSESRIRRLSSWLAGVLFLALAAGVAYALMADVRLNEHALPVALAVAGSLCFIGMLGLGRRAGFLAVPGGLLLTVGLLLMWQAAFGAWGIWTYVWLLVAPASLGVGLVVYGWWSELPRVTQRGHVVLAVGLALFLTVSAIAEIVASINGVLNQSRLLWLVLIIAIGAQLLLGRIFSQRRP